MTLFNSFRILVVVTICASVSNSVQAMPSLITKYLNDENHRITEDGMLPSKMPDSMDFAREVTANWKLILNELPTIAPDPRRQSLLVVASEFLPPKDYVAFVDALCELRSKNQLTPEGLRRVLWAEMPKAGFLAFNFDQPEVSATVAKLEALVNRDFPNEWHDFFKELKSGKMKEHVIERSNREGGRLPELFATSESEPYRQLMGGSVATDVKLLAKNPIESLTLLASNNRNRWSMMVAIMLVLGAGIGLFAIILRVKRRK